MAEVWEVGVWEAPGRSSNRERVCGSWGTCGRQLGPQVWGGAGGRIKETPMRRWDLEPRKRSNLIRGPYLPLSLAGHLVSLLSSLSCPQDPSDLLWPLDPTYVPTRPSVMFTPCFQREENLHLLTAAPAYPPEQQSPSPPSSDPTPVTIPPSFSISPGPFPPR